MSEHDWLVDRFEAHRAHLRAVAYRMLGSQGEADDAVQEVWLRLSRSETSDIENLGGWLTTAVARTFSGRALGAQAALIDGAVGVVWAVGGRPKVASDFTITGGKIVHIDMLAAPDSLNDLDLTILDD